MKTIFSVSIFIAALCGSILAQDQMPKPGVAPVIKIPAVQEKTLPNKLKVAVVTRKNVPLVTVQLLVKSGAKAEPDTAAGLADMTASLLTKGTKTRSATEIAEQIEFLGGSIGGGAGWNASQVTLTVGADKLDQAMAIMSDVVINPAFDQKEIDLLKSQYIDGLSFSLKQPGFLATYVASRYSYAEHPAGGTIDSITAMTRDQIVGFHKDEIASDRSVLIFTGDVTSVRAFALAQKFFGKWKPAQDALLEDNIMPKPAAETKLVKRMLVVDLPNSGQSSVNYVKKLSEGRVYAGKAGKNYYRALVMNSILGGGYSSRLNQEIRIKRGLSYGAGSSFSWRMQDSNFSASTQTKDISAAEVAELVVAELNRLGSEQVSAEEMTPRKSVLNGGFGRGLETTAGLAAQVGNLYSFGLPVTELNSYMTNVSSVTGAQVMSFSASELKGGDIIIVGDAAKFMDDLKKRFPSMQITVVKASELDINEDDLKK